MRERNEIWPEGTDTYLAFEAFRVAHIEQEAAQMARGQLLQRAVDIATEGGWSADEIAAYLGMSRSHISRLRPKRYGIVTAVPKTTVGNHERVTLAVDRAIATARSKRTDSHTELAQPELSPPPSSLPDEIRQIVDLNPGIKTAQIQLGVSYAFADPNVERALRRQAEAAQCAVDKEDRWWPTKKFRDLSVNDEIPRHRTSFEDGYWGCVVTSVSKMDETTVEVEFTLPGAAESARSWHPADDRWPALPGLSG